MAGKNKILAKYYNHKTSAKARGIEFLLSFEEWWLIWSDSGHWNERGRGIHQYQMARIGDKGLYAVGNVKIVTRRENIDEIELSDQARNKMRMSAFGNTKGRAHKGRKISDEHVYALKIYTRAPETRAKMSASAFKRHERQRINLCR